MVEKAFVVAACFYDIFVVNEGLVYRAHMRVIVGAILLCSHESVIVVLINIGGLSD